MRWERSPVTMNFLLFFFFLFTVVLSRLNNRYRTADRSTSKCSLPSHDNKFGCYQSGSRGGNVDTVSHSNEVEGQQASTVASMPPLRQKKSASFYLAMTSIGTLALITSWDATSLAIALPVRFDDGRYISPTATSTSSRTNCFHSLDHH